MRTEQKIKEILNGDNVIITDDRELREVRAELIRIKSNCTITLKQINERLKAK